MFIKQRLTHCSKIQNAGNVPKNSMMMKMDKTLKISRATTQSTPKQNEYVKAEKTQSLFTMQSSTAHWATKYIGKPWMLGGTGPYYFDCWGLVRHIQSAHFKRDMPQIAVGVMQGVHTPDQWHTLRTLIAKTKWGRVTSGERPAESDIALMRSLSGPHVGVVIYADGTRGILHAYGTEGKGGSVIFTPLTQLEELGFQRVDYFRYTQ